MNEDECSNQSSFSLQKNLMVEQLHRLEQMDKILPLHKEQVQQEKQIQIKLNSLNYKRMMSGNTDEQLLDEIEETKLGSNKSKHEALKKYFSSFHPEDIEFNHSDFELLQQMKDRQQQIAEQDLNLAKQQEKSNSIFDDNLMHKWDRVRKKLRMIGRMKRIYDEVKLYGTSCRVETSIKRHEVIQELEQMLNKQNEQINKAPYRKEDYLFYPDSKVKFYWSYILILLLLYTAFVTPVQMTFIDDNNGIWFILELIIDILFATDLLITLNSAFYNDDGTLTTDRKIIMTNYFKSWFLLDLLAIFPSDLVMDESYQNLSSYFKLTRLPRLYKLISINRMMSASQKAPNTDILEMVQDLLNLNSTTVRVLKFFMTVIICVHIMGCVWYLVAKLNDFGPGTWVFELQLLDLDKYELYLTSIYWAVSTICTVGFGDIHAFNDTERIVCIFWMFFGVGFYSFTVGSLSTLLGTLDTRESHLQAKITFMDEFCEETKLSLQMKHRIRKVLEYNSMINIFSQTEVDDFLSEIPTHLKYQIAQAMFNNLRNKVSFFKNKESVFISTIIPKLQPMKVGVGEFVYNKGEYPNQVYFIVNGRVNMVIGVYSITFKTYVTGSYFGEIEIFDNSARFHSARAEIECELMSIEQDVFKKILQQFPDYFEEIKQTSLEKLIREREAIEKLQDLTGLSQTSDFFRKKRAESLYKSIKQRKSIHYIDAASSESDYGEFRQSRIYSYNRKKTNHLTPFQEESFRLDTNTEENESQKKLHSSRTLKNEEEELDKPITLHIPERRMNPSIVITQPEEDHHDLENENNFCSPSDRLLNRQNNQSSQGLFVAPKLKKQQKQDEQPHRFVPPKLQKQNVFHPRKSIKDFQEALKLKEIPRATSFRRTYRKEREIETVVEETIEHDDYNQLQQKLEELLQKIKRQKILSKCQNKKIQFNMISPKQSKFKMDPEESSEEIQQFSDNKDEDKDNSGESSILE